MAAERKEVWLRGERTLGLTALLQPIADALLEALEEIESFMQGFPDDLLWAKPTGCASAGFHLKHITGVIDRLLTYAESRALSEQQFLYLKNETVPEPLAKDPLLERLREGIFKAIERLKGFSEQALTQPRKVGRAGLPSTAIGLCVHCAEHSMRHTGQLFVTVRMLSSGLLSE